MRKIIVAALGAFGGTLGYGYILNAPKNTILPASFIGLAGYIVYILLGMAGFGTMSAYFFSTVFVSVVCELLARKMRTPSTIFLLGALVPLVPGYNFYLAMLALVENRGAADGEGIRHRGNQHCGVSDVGLFGGGWARVCAAHQPARYKQPADRDGQRNLPRGGTGQAQPGGGRMRAGKSAENPRLFPADDDSGLRAGGGKLLPAL